jgi:hypothetical protein
MRRLIPLSVALVSTLGLTASDASAQHRHHRSRVHVGGAISFGGPFYYGPYYRPYYAPYYGPYGYDPYYRPHGYYHDPYETGGVRLKVHPNEAKVLVDGYYAGVVDDFDGMFQQLDLKPGRHEITLKLAGYRTHRMRVYAAPGRTMKIAYDLQKGEGADEPEGVDKR